ncbi:uncharacterized protein LOC105698861 [Orussus abietinus]|uniref:uncharacterized protein LOC105698861 n=1 Tax=Orussus abietinus TaxID=222816 RepID=UPI000626D499|nr:uncharacterized protein LOC105698861 [Orussus abietinus]
MIMTVQTLFDFTRSDEVDNWVESSDTTRPAGMSKAVLVMQKTEVYQRAVLFTLFNPQPNGSGFAAIRCDGSFNLSSVRCIIMKCRGQGANLKYKMLLRHKGLGKESPIYGQVFTVPEDELATVKLPLSNFKPYHRGQELSLQSHPLDTSMITSISLKIDNGPYLPDNQPGVSALEIDWIKATK